MSKKLTATEAKATEIATTVSSEKVGFPIAIIISIITALLPEIVKCFSADDPATVKKYLANRYNPKVHNIESDPYQGYRPSTVKTLMGRAKYVAMSMKPRRRLNDDAAREIAIRTLDDARTGDNVKMMAVIDESYDS